MNAFYVHLSSDASLDYFPDNKASRFSIYFPEAINLPGQWSCALAEISMPSSSTGEVYIACDVIEGSFTSHGKYPILRRLLKKARYMEFANLHYVPVARNSIQSLSIYISESGGSLISSLSGRVRCTLHFKREK